MRAAWLAGLALAACGDNREAPLPPVPPGQLALDFERIELEGGDPLAITHVAFVPGTDELLVANKSRTVTHYRLPAEATRAIRLGSFDVPGVDETADCGLLSIAFDPAFADNRFIYFAACSAPTANRISRHVFEPRDYGAIARTATTIFDANLPTGIRAWHNIGAIGFDAAGSLWALLGDKNDPRTSQDPASALGKVIRIVPLPGGGHAPDPRNPFVDTPGHDPDVVASGLRSPWRGALDELGRLWIGDVGESGFEEVNVTRFAGENFGNAIVEGPCTLGPEVCARVVDPVVHWDRSTEHRYSLEDPLAAETSRRVVWIGATYPRSIAQDRYRGLLFDRMLVGDFAGGWIRSIALDTTDRVARDEHVGHLEAPTAWAVGHDGYLYVSSYGSVLAFPYVPGALYRAKAR